MRYFSIQILLLFSHQLIAQTYNPKIQNELINSFESVNYLRTFESLGVKTPGSKEIVNTRDWLVNQYQKIGYDSIWLDSFEEQSIQQQNIIVKKTGIGDDYLIVCSHYDTRSGPGVNDNGTGVSATLTAAEVLFSQTTNRTVYFIHFSGEEQGFVGSYNFVNQPFRAFPGKLYAVLNVDQLGGTLGFSGNDMIYCERDETSPPATNNPASAMITDTIANLAKLYTNLTPVISAAYSSDYVPFQEKDFVITGIYQFSACPYIHTPADSFNKIDTTSFKEAVKLTIAATIHFAQIPSFISTITLTTTPFILQTAEGDIILKSDPMEQNIESIKICDVSGRILAVYRLNLIRNEVVKVSEFGSGIYVVVVSGNHEEIRARSLIVVP